MGRRIEHDYRPGAEQRALFPPVSGNAINGLGETRRRPPTPLYWHDPDTIPHGELQKYFYRNAGRLAAQRRETSQMEAHRGPAQLDPVAPRRAEDTPEGWSRRVKEAARARDADLVGVARMDPQWVFEGRRVDEPWIVVLGVAMDHAELAKAPPRPGELGSADEVSRQYNRAARASKALANWIRGQGWNARAHTGPMAGDLLSIPAAIAAGFGQLGKHGSIINDRFGASFRLASVTTDLVLVADQPVDIGVDDFCMHCQVCSDACPPEAIFDTKQMVRGELKWYVDFDRCIPYFNDTLGCGICIARCPWSLPGVAPRLSEKMLRRRARTSAS